MSAARRTGIGMLQRATEYTFTTLFWMAWLYLIMPLLSLMMWAAGVHFFVDEMLVRGGYEALLRELVNYGVVILCMLFVILVWVDWNIRHYGDHNKRTHPPQPLSNEELAASTGLSVAEVSSLQQAKRAVIGFDDNDRPLIRAGDEPGQKLPER